MSNSAKRPPTPPPTEPVERPLAPTREPAIKCQACGLPSRAAMIVKDLGGGRGRCVNTAACEKRQRKLPKAGA